MKGGSNFGIIWCGCEPWFALFMDLLSLALCNFLLLFYIYIYIYIYKCMQLIYSDKSYGVMSVSHLLNTLCFMLD